MRRFARTALSRALLLLNGLLPRRPYAVALMYHDISEDAADTFAVSPDTLRAHIEDLRRRGFTFVFAEDLASWTPAMGKCCALTFDDGYAGHALLNSLGVPVTLFLTTHPDPNEYQAGKTPAAPERLARDLGTAPTVRLGAHGVTHRRWTRMSPEELEQELLESKSTLAQWTGKDVTTCAYPKGSTNPGVTAMVRRHFRYAFLADGGAVSRPPQDPYTLPRVGIFRGTSLSEFRLRTSRLFPFLLSLWKQAKQRPISQHSQNSVPPSLPREEEKEERRIKRGREEMGQQEKLGTISATVGILTFNSAATLQRALESVRDFEDILVGDGGSTDGTLDIARSFGARIISQTEQGRITDYAAERNNLLWNARFDWFFALDADETASPELVEEIRTIVQRDAPPYIYNIPMGMMFEGREIRYYSSLPGKQVRFFSRKSQAKYEKPIHERPCYTPQEETALAGKWYIHWDQSRLSPAVFDRYVRLDAQQGARLPLFKFLRWKVWHNIAGILFILAYVLRVRCTKPWRDCAPLRMEWRKVVHKLKHIGYAFTFRYGRHAL